MSKPIRYCKAADCQRRCHGDGYCIVHYKRLRRSGTLDISKVDGEPIWYRLARRIRGGTNGCWIWRGTVNNNGYGIILYQGRPRLVHRVVNELLCGPTDLVLHHVCRVKRCVNPHHMQPMTRKQHLHVHALEDWA